MNRRDFLTASATVTAAATVTTALEGQANAADAGNSGREYYVLTRYHLRRGPKQKVFEDFVREALLPAVGRLGIGPVGVFNLMIGPESPSLYILTPYKSFDDFASLQTRLREDPEFRKAGEAALAAPASDPLYLRNENSLLVSFQGMPKLEVPAQTKAGKGRIFELRTYESHSKSANLKKVGMFNDGEIAIFRRTGLTPVFFGETLVGTRQPNLTYMLVFDDLAARDQAWRTFGGDADWKKLSTTPGLTDAEIVTDISNVLLRPTPYSQI